MNIRSHGSTERRRVAVVHRWWMLVPATLLLLVAAAPAEPRVPSSDSEVLEKVSLTSMRKRAKAIRSASQSADPGTAAGEARRLIDYARSESNPRYLGQAQAVLAPWWSAPAPPAEIRLLRATIRQSLHEFPAALLDLEAVVAAEPGNAQAWLTLSSIHLVRGDWEDARQAALRLVPLTSKLVAATAAAAIGSVNGQLPESYDHLTGVLREYGTSPPKIRLWSWTLMGEMAERLGRWAEAEHHFQRALREGVEDGYLIGAYSDFLLRRGSHQEVIDFLAERPESDGTLLRLAIAHRRLSPGSTEAKSSSERLAARFASASLRGGALHQREEARFCLEVLGQPERALELALRNWRVQKEPADIKILLESAQATRHSAVMRDMWDWIDAAGYQDVSLSRVTRDTARR